ncbi:MAG: molybdopterin-dependent oxidoreductase [bacterium]
MTNTVQNERKGFCPYCGCGCRLKFQCENSTIIKTFQDADDPVSNGKACIKGLTSHEVINTNRLVSPAIRPVKSRGLIECSWEKAYAAISKKLKELEQYDDNGIQDLIFFVPDGQSSNEFNYLFSKLCRSVYHSNNIDSCARLCHQATAEANKSMMGIPAIPNYSMDDLSDVDCFLMIGTDPVEDYPVMFDRILEAKKKGAKIITLDVARNSTTELADMNLQVTTDGVVPFMSWLISKFVDSDKISKDSKQFHGFAELIESAKNVSQKNPPSIIGLDQGKVDVVYDMLLGAKKIGLCFGMGVTQHANGTQNVESIISLGLLLNAVVFPNRGKINVQGAGDVGGHPLWDSQVVEKNGKWNTKYRSHKGRMLTEALYDKDIKFLWVVSGDLSQSMPDLNLLDESFRHKFIVYQGHHPARVMDFASVVLPMAMLPEYEGTVTNGERRVRGVSDVSSSVYKSPVDIILEYSKYISAEGFDFNSVKDITKEITKVVPGYDKLTIDGIYSDKGEFADKEPKFRKFNKIRADLGHFQGDSKYPFVLTTARNRFQFCTGNESRNSKSLLQLAGDKLVLMNDKDMDNLGILDGQELRIISSVGEIKTNIFKSSDVLKRRIVAQFHFPKLLVNKLTPLVLDPRSGTPAYKEVPVRIEVLL